MLKMDALGLACDIVHKLTPPRREDLMGSEFIVLVINNLLMIIYLTVMSITSGMVVNV